MKEFIRRTFPRFFVFARGVKDQLKVEWQVIRQVGPRILVERILPRNWEGVLPLQAPRTFTVDGLTATTSEELVRELRSAGNAFALGGHTIYLPPTSLARAPFLELSRNYPPDAALKISKNPGGIEESDYMHGFGSDAVDVSSIHRSITHSHRHLTLVANVLHVEGVGPRLYDLVELRCGNQVWTAYVIAHCSGRVPTRSEWAAGMDALKRLERDRILRVTAPRGFDHMDFRCPDCNGNGLVDVATGRFQFVDFQNFVLADYGAYLTSLGVTAAGATHFGRRLLVRGGSYLYQSIPGVALPAKRDTEARIEELGRLMVQAGVAVCDRLVLAFGCNLGMMMGECLKLGARWVHGWDMHAITPYTERLLFATGCTRFSLTSGKIVPEQPVEANVPTFLRPSLDGCVITYLAVRGHIGWLHALGRIRWAFMLYEGHEGETPEDLGRFLTELGKLTRVRVAAVGTCRDGDSKTRPIAVIVREGRVSMPPKRSAFADGSSAS